MQRADVVTVRERGVAVVQCGAFALVAGLSGVWTFGALADIAHGRPAPVTVVQAALFGVLGLVCVAALIGSVRQRAVVDSAQLLVANILTRRRIAWADVESIIRTPTVSRSGLWWLVVVALRGTDRVVRIQASATRDEQRSAAIAERLIALAPPGHAVADRLLDPAPELGAAEPAGRPRRLVIRSHTIEGMSTAVPAWCGVGLLLVIIGGVMIAQARAAFVLGGAGLIVGTVALGVLIHLLTVDRVVVTARGIERGRIRRRRVPWSDVADLLLVPDGNGLITRRVAFVALVLPGGECRPLTPTTRAPERAHLLLRLIRAHRPPP